MGLYTAMKPDQMRGAFGQNLRKLIGKDNVSQVCRDLEINRTQFNRYLSGDSWPRPDVLARISDFFGVDCRILLEPLSDVVTDSAFRPAVLDDGKAHANGTTYMKDGKGGLVPVSLVKPADLLEDDTVRKICAFGIALSDQVARFKEHTFEDIGIFDATLAEEYGVSKGGKKGNKTLMSYDGLFKVTVQVADYIDFGPQLQIAKGLVDECLNEWAANARPEIQSIVTRAFNTDKAGKINRSEIFMLLRLKIEDDRWQRAMDAIHDAMRVVGSKTYVRCHRRDTNDAEWQAITIDLAKA